MNFKIPPLKYSYSALEPYIDRETMKIHHGKHHAGYVQKLEKTLKSYPRIKSQKLATVIKNLKKLPKNIQKPVQNNGGGQLNHTLFWDIMTPNSSKKPSENLLKVVSLWFGNFDKFKQDFSKAAVEIFGSGWAWLVVNKKKLEITSTKNQDSPLTENKIPILGIDVWEHAYYLKYQNRRADYIEAWWNVVNWRQVEENFKRAKVKYSN